MPETTKSYDQAVKLLIAFVLAGGLGPGTRGNAVCYSPLEESEEAFTWVAALENFDLDAPPAPVNRYRVTIYRKTGEISRPQLIQQLRSELAEAIYDATGHYLVSSARFTDGTLSISYKINARKPARGEPFGQEPPDIVYVLQLRHHGRVASMDAFMLLVSRTCDSKILPVPPVYPIPGESNRQKKTGWGRQITQFIPGVMADTVYHQLSHEDKLIFVQKMALAYEACWKIQLTEDHLIGELVADMVDDSISLKIEPDRHYGLGGPFSSVREYLRAHIRYILPCLERAEGIDEYKERFLSRIQTFVNNCMHKIPAIVEEVPIVAMHTDMGLHNIIVSAEQPTEIQAIIDWEFLASAPYATIDGLLELLFRRFSENRFGKEYDHADQLREAFWDAIPQWKKWQKSDAVETFLEWWRFGQYMQPQAKNQDLSTEEQEGYWQENIRVVEHLLDKYGGSDEGGSKLNDSSGMEP